MEEMEKLFDKPILEQLFKFRKEYFERRIYDSNAEIKQIEQEVVNAQEEMDKLIRSIIKDEENLKDYEQLSLNLELKSGAEIDFWSLQYYKLGITEFTKIKQEVFEERYAKYLDDEEMQEPINELMDESFDDILDELENEKAKKLSNTYKYKKIADNYNEISKKYPRAVLAFEDSKADSLTKDEVKGLIKLIEQEKETSLDETKLAVLLGIKIGASL